MKLLFLSLLLTFNLVFSASSCTPKYGPGDHLVTLVNGRSFSLFVPDTINNNGLNPLLVHIHGCGVLHTAEQPEYQADNPTYEWKLTHMNVSAVKATNHSFIVAYPFGSEIVNGTCTSLGGLAPLGFNAGLCCGGVTLNDVEYLSLIVQHLVDTSCIDSNLVFGSGFSNGAMMAHRLACQAPGLFKALAAVEGNIMFGGDFWSCAKQPASHEYKAITNNLNDNNLIQEKNASSKVSSMLLTCGSLDTICIFEFGATVAFWLGEMKCNITNTQKVFTSNTTSCVQYNQCNDNSVLQVCSISNLNHCWPGEDDSLRVDICPKQSPENFDASNYILQFFSTFF